MTDNNVWILIIVSGVAVIIFLLIILLLVKIGILGRRSQQDNMNKVMIKDGKNINYMNGMSSEIGLNGFGEDRSETLVVELTKEQKYLTIEFVNVYTGMIFSGILVSRLMIGRKNMNNISGYLEISDDNSISKNHAEIGRINSSVYIKDLGSTNHTWVNGNYLTDMADVFSGDLIRLGNSEYRIYIR